jgi:S-layer homology domain
MSFVSTFRISCAVLAVVVAAAVASPARAQPFSDTPATHWAYEAIAALAARGLIEGYPYGAFRGDRAITRYEMALIVARLLSRIEALARSAQPGAGPALTRNDLDLIIRLANEFRPELAAQQIHLSAIDAELNAIRARLDDVRVGGAFHFRYDLQQSASGPPLPGNNNPQTGAIDAAAAPRGNVAEYIFKLTFDGSVAPNVHVIAAVVSDTEFTALNSGAIGPVSVNGAGFLQGPSANIDNLFLDWKNAFGTPLEIWLGRFGGTTPPGTTYPVQFGPFGLLMNTSPNTWEDTTADSGATIADGMWLSARFRRLADLQIQGTILRITGNTGATTYASGEDAYGLDANVRVAEGLRVGADYVGNTIGQFGAAPFAGPASLGVLYHLYGPSGPSFNPTTPHCPVDMAGIGCPALGNGLGAYVQADLSPAVHLDAEWAQWNDEVLGGSDAGYQAVLTGDLKSLFHLKRDLSVSVGYLCFGENFYPPYGTADADVVMGDYIYPGNARGVTANITFNPTAAWTLYGSVVAGSFVSNNQSLLEYEVGVKWSFANNADVTFLRRDLAINGVGQIDLYRAEVDYQF